MKVLLYVLSGAVVLVGLAWYLWGEPQGREPVRLMSRPEPAPAPVAPASQASSTAPMASGPVVPVIAVGVGATVQPVAAMPPTAGSWEEVEAKVRATEAEWALKNPGKPFTYYYTHLEAALEQARKSMPATSAPGQQEPPQSAPGAGVNPFSR